MEELLIQILAELKAIRTGNMVLVAREQSGADMAHEVQTKLAARKMLAQIETEKAQGLYDKPRRRARVAA
jgi:hypothetical protein